MTDTPTAEDLKTITDANRPRPKREMTAAQFTAKVMARFRKRRRDSGVTDETLKADPLFLEKHGCRDDWLNMSEAHILSLEEKYGHGAADGRGRCFDGWILIPCYIKGQYFLRYYACDCAAGAKRRRPSREEKKAAEKANRTAEPFYPTILDYMSDHAGEVVPTDVQIDNHEFNAPATWRNTAVGRHFKARRADK